MTSTYDWKADVDEEESKLEETQGLDALVEQAPEEEAEGQQRLYQISAPKKISDRPILLIGLVFGGMTGLILLVVMGYFTVSVVGQAISSEKNQGSDPALESFSAKTPFNQTDTITKEQRLQEQLTSKETDANITRFNSSAKPKPKSKTQQQTTPAPQPRSNRPPANRIVAPKVVYRDRVVKEPAPPPKVVYKEVAPPPTPKPVVPPTPPVQPTGTSQIPRVEPPQDPYEQWTQLASLGMVGGGEITGNPTSPLAVQDAIYPDSSNGKIPVFDPSAFPDVSGESEPESSQPTIKLPLGSVVKGKLMHDVSFVDNATSTDKAVVELSEPLGEIPKGAMISTQIESVDDNGALSMSILGFEYDNVYQSVSLPEIQVTSARASRGGGNLGRLFQDVVGIGLDVLSNETGQEIEFDNGRVASISTDSNSGLLDRSVEAVSSRLLERNRSTTTRSKKSPKVKEGSTVKFTVIEPIS